MLQGLGLDALSERVYRTLLAEPALDEAALAHALALSPAQIATAWDRLTELALLRESRQDPGKRYPVSLDRCVSLLLQRKEAELEARRKEVAEGRAVVAAVAESAARRRSQTAVGVERITALDDIQALMESLGQAATTGICSMVPSVMSAEMLQASRQLDEDLMAKGVTCKTLCHEGIRHNAAALAYEHWMIGLGAEVRTAAVLPMRLLIVDRSCAVLPFDPESRDEGAMLVTAPGMVTALGELFDRFWEDAAPLTVAPQVDEATGLTEGEAELLKILSTGLTDDAAAKRLGVSVRTVKRRMNDLMRRLEAGSRFEAGYRAAKRGWL